MPESESGGGQGVYHDTGLGEDLFDPFFFLSSKNKYFFFPPSGGNLCTQ